MAIAEQGNAVPAKQDGESREISKRESSVPVGRESFPSVRRFMGDVEHAFDEWARWGWPLSWPRSSSSWGWKGESDMGWMPQIEVSERNGSFIVRAELPGLKREDINVEIAGGSLTLSGERRENREEREEGYYRSERSYGKFFRSIPLPEGITGEDARAEFRDGVLEITMSAPEGKGSHRRIDVE